MKKIIKTLSLTIKECVIPGDCCDLTVTVNVYEETRKFLWWKWNSNTYDIGHAWVIDGYCRIKTSAYICSRKSYR